MLYFIKLQYVNGSCYILCVSKLSHMSFEFHIPLFHMMVKVLINHRCLRIFRPVKEILSNLVGGNLRAFPRTSGFGGISEYQPLRDRSLLGHHTKVVFPPFPSHDKFSQKRRHRGHVRQLPEVRRPQTFAPASAARSVCVRSVAARFFQPPRLA